MGFLSHPRHTLPNFAPYGGLLAVVKQLPHSLLAEGDGKELTPPWIRRVGWKYGERGFGAQPEPPGRCRRASSFLRRRA